MKDKPTGQLLNDLRVSMDRADELRSQLKECDRRRYAIEIELVERRERDGVDSFSNDAMTVSMREDFRVGYDPEQWGAIIEWAAKTGNTHVVQRRISAKPIQELLDNGERLPGGIRLDPFVRVNVRRK